MRCSIVRWLMVAGAIVALPIAGYAQEAVLSGTVTDTTGGVLPGVTIEAVHEASGNRFETVTDARGGYRLAVRTGAVRVTAQLSGFATVVRSGLELLLGQQLVVNLQMALSTVQETVTVTGESPLVDVTQSRPSGNVDARQMQELPLNGRNWQDLAMIAVGNRSNAVGESPDPSGNFQLNIDGQQVTNNVTKGGTFGNPRFSRDAIAEFEFVANRFDATQGRSSGSQVNAITKSGTNTPSGTLSGYFRDDAFNAADFVARRVLPYSNQQVSGTFGGPIRRDRIHFFANYEYEREPFTQIYSSPFPSFNIDLHDARTERKGAVRLDVQFSPRLRLSTRANTSNGLQPGEGGGGATNHPSRAITTRRKSDQVYAALTQVLSNRTLNEIKAGYAGSYRHSESPVSWPNHPQASIGITHGAPQIVFRGYSMGVSNQNTPQKIGQENWSVRDDFTHSYNARGRHDLKVGGEYIDILTWLLTCRSCVGRIDAQGGPIPANIEALFPVWNDLSTWNLAALSPITRQYTQGVGDFTYVAPRKVYAAWMQDDWSINPRLTLNLGLRYDLSTDVFAEDVVLLPFLPPGRKNDTDNLGPRLGFAFSLNDRTVLRGGGGIYYGDVSAQADHGSKAWTQIANQEVLNDGRPDFAANPYNGPQPTFDEVIAKACSTANVPGCVRRNVDSNFGSADMRFPHSYQTSVGVQRQLADTMAFEADYVYSGERDSLFTGDTNVAYDPATGANYPFTDFSKRPYPEWGRINQWFSQGRFYSHSLQAAFTKRFSNRWQASATYLLSGEWSFDKLPLSPGCQYPFIAPGVCNVPFEVAPDIAENKYYLTGSQRHRAVFNGIWEVAYGFQLSGVYFYGDNGRSTPTSGVDVRRTGGSGGRLRPDGTLIARNSFRRDPLHRVDLRVQRRFRLAGRVGVDGILEVFNLLNHENFGSYVTNESNRNFGRPQAVNNVAYAPRVLQLGFRLAF